MLEGGGIDVNGEGLLLVTEEWLLSDVQVRNPGLTRADYEQIFAEWLGIRQTIWLGEGCVGDDTHGHVDDIARFVAPDTIVLAVEDDPADENHARSMDNLRRLERLAGSGEAGPLRVVTLPFPAPGDHERRAAAGQLRELLHRQRRRARADLQRPERSRRAQHARGADARSRAVVGIHAVDLVWGLGTLHCLTQQEPAGTLKSGQVHEVEESVESATSSCTSCSATSFRAAA